jgi:hypothetical protein
LRRHVQPLGYLWWWLDAVDAQDLEAAGLALLGAFQQER